MRLLRIAFLVWAVAWICLAGYTAYEAYALRSLSNTVVKAGTAVDTTGKALQGIGDIPFVGGRVHTLADQVRAAGQSAVASGRSSRGSVLTLSVLLGIAIGLIPTIPVLALYLPLRLAWRREQRALARALREHGDDPLLDEYLARRAVDNLPYRELRDVTETPWEDLQAGRFRMLADAELRRLGFPARNARELVS